MRSAIILYFLGVQVEDDPYAFQVRDYRKLALITEPKGLFRDDPHWGFLAEPEPAISTSSTDHPIFSVPSVRETKLPVIQVSQPPVSDDLAAPSPAHARPAMPKVRPSGATLVPRSTPSESKPLSTVATRQANPPRQHHVL